MMHTPYSSESAAITTAAGQWAPQARGRATALYLVGVATLQAVPLGVTTADDWHSELDEITILADGTDAGSPWEPGESDDKSAPEELGVESHSTAVSVSTLKRLSGLTWEQLGQLFGVDRRSMHYWASGKPLGPANEERLGRVLGLIQAVDRGSASLNRSLLLSPLPDGSLPIDVLARGEFERALELLGEGSGRPPTRRASLSPEARAERQPPPPAELVGALQDPALPKTKGRLVVPLKRGVSVDEA